MGAFARAMMDQLADLEHDVAFCTRIAGRNGEFHFSCKEFLSLRNEEKDWVENAFADLVAPRVLDIGCGIGRHLKFVQQIKPGAQLSGVEINPTLRGVCAHDLPNAMFFTHLTEVPESERFDGVLLMGNGLGVFGSEENTRQQLRFIKSLLTDVGCILLESSPIRGPFFETRMTIEYDGETDGPFSWGFASEDWVKEEMEENGLTHWTAKRNQMGGFIGVAR